MKKNKIRFGISFIICFGIISIADVYFHANMFQRIVISIISCMVVDVAFNIFSNKKK